MDLGHINIHKQKRRKIKSHQLIQTVLFLTFALVLNHMSFTCNAAAFTQT